MHVNARIPCRIRGIRLRREEPQPRGQEHLQPQATNYYVTDDVNYCSASKLTSQTHSNYSHGTRTFQGARWEGSEAPGPWSSA